MPTTRLPSKSKVTGIEMFCQQTNAVTYIQNLLELKDRFNSFLLTPSPTTSSSSKSSLVTLSTS